MQKIRLTAGLKRVSWEQDERKGARTLQTLVVLPRLEVIVEKIAVEDGLHRTRDPDCGRPSEEWSHRNGRAPTAPIQCR